MRQITFGVVDPRTQEIVQVATVKAPDLVELRRYFNTMFVVREARTGTSLYSQWRDELAGRERDRVRNLTARL